MDIFYNSMDGWNILLTLWIQISIIIIYDSCFYYGFWIYYYCYWRDHIKYSKIKCKFINKKSTMVNLVMQLQVLSQDQEYQQLSYISMLQSKGSFSFYLILDLVLDSLYL
ncbi:unnamed protein product [Paramecium pentaurelia]|uniref:Transmembrane protein n=1 Tax=Paramecium pentaurelia TaxID=43138 RepID=A0A8S1X9R5_9CILI|nr:unnamed protein product [Paramecium pentaurelia]